MSLTNAFAVQENSSKVILFWISSLLKYELVFNNSQISKLEAINWRNSGTYDEASML